MGQNSAQKRAKRERAAALAAVASGGDNQAQVHLDSMVFEDTVPEAVSESIDGSHLGTSVGKLVAIIIGSIPVIQSLMTNISPILGVVKAIRAFIPVGNPTHKDVVCIQAVHSVRHTSKWAGYYHWVVLAVCVPALTVRQVRTWRLGKLFDSARSIPYMGWLPSGYCTIPVRSIAAIPLLAYLGSWVVGQFVQRLSSPIGAKWTTRFIKHSLRIPSVSSSQQRQVFVDLPLVSAKIQQNHTHGAAARDRNTSGATSALAAQMLGLEPYFVQQSLSDVRRARAGDRSFHWAKDLAIPPKEFSFDPLTQAAVLVDVDHYINMPMLLAQKPGTYFVCTFQPTTCAESVGEYSFRFLENGDVAYRVSGGAEYIHPIWDYSGDTLLVEDSGFFQKSVVAYHIDRKRVDDHHVVIMLSCIGRFTTLAVLPASLLIEGKHLKRFNPVRGDYVVMDVVRPDGLYRSIAVIGNYDAVTLPRAHFDAVHHVAIVAKVPITPAMVASNIAPSSPAGLPTERLPPGHAALIASYTRAGVPVFAPVVYPPSESMLPLSFDKHDYDAPVPLAGFGSPLVGPSYGHASSIASDNECITGRVEAFQDYNEEPIPPSLVKYMEEFIERFIPVAHRGHPVDHDEVRSRQSKPSQKSVLDEAASTGDKYKRSWVNFQKVETYQKPTDPRNISIAAPATKLAYSTFQYAFTDCVMQDVDWYAFNKTPADIAARVCEVLGQARWSVIADGSRFDGHVRRRARILERMCMLRFFAREHHAALNEAMDEQIALPGVTEYGRRFNSGYSRGSGSLETANFNSIVTAFIGYCAQRNTTVNGVRKSPDQSWASLGIYGGDDSLEGDVDAKALEVSAKLMGQEYEIEVYPRGEVGVNFLNRQFGPDVWTGDISSMANPARLLSKLWVGPAHLENVLQRLGERLSGYYRMDRHSPVIGPITVIAHSLLGEFKEGVLMPWDGKHDVDTNWPNEDSGWMMDLFLSFIPDFDLARFQSWIDLIHLKQDPKLLLRAPLCTSVSVVPVVVKKTTVVGDELVLPEESPVDGDEPDMDEWGNYSVDQEVAETPKALELVELPDERSEQFVASETYTAAERAVIGSAVVAEKGRFAPKSTPSSSSNAKQAKSSPKSTSSSSSSSPKSTSSSSSNAKQAKGSPNRGGKTKVGNNASPEDWVKPKPRKGEARQAFEARLKTWEAVRAKVAKRLGVVLTSAPEKSATKK